MTMFALIIAFLLITPFTNTTHHGNSRYSNSVSPSSSGLHPSKGLSPSNGLHPSNGLSQSNDLHQNKGLSPGNDLHRRDALHLSNDQDFIESKFHHERDDDSVLDYKIRSNRRRICRSENWPHEATTLKKKFSRRSRERNVQKSSHRDDGSVFNHIFYPYLKRRKRDFVSTDPSYLYARGVIPWHFDTENRLPSMAHYNQVRTVMAYYENKTCLRFPEIGTPDASGIVLSTHKYIRIGDYGGCWAYTGRAQEGDFLEVSLGENCDTFGVVSHELAHVMGVQHEQSRTDRDKYITINLENVNPQKWMNFERGDNFTTNLTPYDLNSITHYGTRYFSNNSKVTITSNDPELSFLMGQRNRPTHYDLMGINLAYKCSARCGPKTCENDGYVDMTCACICPHGLAGKDCTELNPSVSNENCGGFYKILNIDKPVNFSASEIPYSYNVCAWIFTSDYASWIELSFSEFNLDDYHNELEIRYNLPGQTGPEYHSMDSSKVFDTKTYREPERRPYIAVFLRTWGRGNTRDVRIAGTVIAKTDDSVSAPPHLAAKPYFNADFETGFSGFTQDGDLKWLRHSGKTISQDTGPIRASQGNFYSYLESSHGIANYTAILTTLKTFEGDEPLCVDFDYHIYGNSLGELQVLLKNDSDYTEILWSRKQDKATWMKENLLIDIQPWSYKIQFKAIRGHSFTSDVAIDDILIAPGPCRRITVEVDCKPCDNFSESRCSATMTNRGLPFCTSYGWEEQQENGSPWQTEKCQFDVLESPTMGYSYMKTCGLGRCTDMGIDYGLVFYQTKCMDVQGLNCQRCCIEDCDIDASNGLTPSRTLAITATMTIALYIGNL